MDTASKSPEASASTVKRLALLSLDGGGVWGLSSLFVLQMLMRILDSENPPKPCDVFDMIGGTSTGGFIAILLGRLQMTVTECVETYLRIFDIYSPHWLDSLVSEDQTQIRFNHDAFERGIKDILARRGIAEDELFREDASNVKCKTFVCTRSGQTSATILMSNYSMHHPGNDVGAVAKIWEVACATLASTPFFQPISIDGRTFTDGSMNPNNPVEYLWNEAQEVFSRGQEDWRLEYHLQCLVSIGAGPPPDHADYVMRGFLQTLGELAMDSERTANRFERAHARLFEQRLAFRFNVDRGVEVDRVDLGLDEAATYRHIRAMARAYLDSENIRGPALECVNMMAESDKYREHKSGDSGETPEMSSTEKLFDAVQRGETNEARARLDEGHDPNAHSISSLTPLHVAAKLGNVELAELLVDHGADPNAKENTGSTPLHMAAQYGHIEVVRLLKGRWADINVQNDAGSTPVQAAKDDNIARLLRDQPVQADHTSEQATKPMFRITINGNDLDQGTEAAAEASSTKYILIQSLTPLNPPERQQLANEGVTLHDYVSKNTYLCHYGGVGLERIRRIQPIVYVDVYRTQFKISSDLRKTAQPEGLDPIDLDLILHYGVDQDSESLRALIADAADAQANDIRFYPGKVRLVALPQRLGNLAAIDEVRCIEEIGKIDHKNDRAYMVLLGSPQGQRPHADYEGDGQVIAIADTGLDTGDDPNTPIHQAFANRVVDIYDFNGDGTGRDVDGHGTHVCGSAVGDGRFDGNTGVTGTAPAAKLVMQSIWVEDADGERSPGHLKPPGHLRELFNPPYRDHDVRVHSNSWGSSIEGLRQLGYTSAAREIDDFVWNQPDMVICFAAGNDHVYQLTATLGAQAAAKNCITVGASENERMDVDVTYHATMVAPSDLGAARIATNRSRVALFSAQGPTRFDSALRARVKPDVVAPGTHVLSARSSVARKPPVWPGPNDLWCFRSGTSMATALVAGCAAVLREVFMQRNPGDLPSAALIKALLINGADILPQSREIQPGYSHRSGYGRVSLSNSIGVAERIQGTGMREGELSYTVPEFSGKIPAMPDRTRLKITLTWSDPPGDIIRNRLHLKLELRRELGVELPEPRKAKYAPTGYNVVQQVMWESKAEEEEFTFHVRTTRLDISPQSFAVVWRFY